MEKILAPTLRSYVLRKHGIGLLISLLLMGFATYLMTGSFGYNSIYSILQDHSFAILALGVLILAYVAVESQLHHIVTRLHITPDGYVVYERGILRHEKKKASFTEITDTAIEQSVLDRLLNTCTLKINTGGSMDYEIVMRDLDAHLADSFHDFVVKGKDKKQLSEDKK